jgi:hypothetical protein
MNTVVVDSSTTSSLFKDLQGVVDKLIATRNGFEAARDKRAVFAHSYSIMSQFLHDALVEDVKSASPRFKDAQWVETIAVSFAGRYFEAIDPDATEVVKPWRDVFETQRERTFVIEDLIYSMMAHIGHDLAMTLVDISATRDRIHDYHAMNDVLANCIDNVQRDVSRRYQPWLAWVDRFVGDFDEFLTDYGIRITRSLAWYNFDRLSDPQSRVQALQTVQESTGHFVRFARKPKYLGIRILIAIVRCLPSWRRWPKPGS